MRKDLGVTQYFRNGIFHDSVRCAINHLTQDILSTQSFYIYYNIFITFSFCSLSIPMLLDRFIKLFFSAWIRKLCFKETLFLDCPMQCTELNNTVEIA